MSMFRRQSSAVSRSTVPTHPLSPSQPSQPNLTAIPAPDPRLRAYPGLVYAGSGTAGQRYYADAPRYLSTDRALPDMLPHDTDETQREVFQQHLLRVVFNGRPYLANYDPGAHVKAAQALGQTGQTVRILDVGCGSGAWCDDVIKEMTQRYGEQIAAQIAVQGVDAFAPPATRRPRGWEFVQHNILTPPPHLLPWSVQYIHLQDLVCSLPCKHQEIAKLLRAFIPTMAQNAWIEWTELGLPQYSVFALAIDKKDEQGRRWYQDFAHHFPVIVFGSWCQMLTAQRELHFLWPDHLEQDFREAGLHQIQTQRLQLPLGHVMAERHSRYQTLYGARAKRIGELALEAFKARMLALAPLLLSQRALLIEKDTFLATLNSLDSELERAASYGVDCYWPLVSTLGQRERMTADTDGNATPMPPWLRSILPE